MAVPDEGTAFLFCGRFFQTCSNHTNLKALKRTALLALFFCPMLMVAQSFDIQGHRGSRGLSPENTIPAFLKAMELGVHTLELDVCISQDKRVVVSHEPYFHAGFSSHPDGRPVTKAEEKALNLYQMTYAQIRQYDTGRRGNADFPEQQKQPTFKPLLSEVIAAAEQYATEHHLPKPHYNIEIKSEAELYNTFQPGVEEFSALVYAEITKQLPTERVILQSFDFNVLKYWKAQINAKHYQPVRLAALVTMKGVKKTLEELGFVPDYFSPYYKLLGKDKVEQAHEAGMKVMPWTVNDVEAMRKMKEIGTDGLITDYPDRAKAAFQN